jgi:hypothetical protein
MSELIEAAETFKVMVESYRKAHFKAGDHLRLWHYVLGFGLIVVSAVVSGSVLQSTGADPSRNLTLTAGILAIVVTVLTSIQTTFKLGERAELHRSAANGFGKIRNDLEMFIDRPHLEIEKAWDELETIVSEIASVEAGAPGYMRRTYVDANQAVRAELEKRRPDAGRAPP